MDQKTFEHEMNRAKTMQQEGTQSGLTSTLQKRFEIKEGNTKRISTVIMMVVLFILSPATIFAANINGVIAIVIGSGDIKYGAKINVFLTTKEISIIPVTENPSKENDYTRAVIKSLGDAFTKAEEEIKNNPSYIKAKTMTSLEGKFRFADIEPGKYFIVVTFPSRIAMNRVFWQIPIDIADKDVDIELSNDNLTLPAHIDIYWEPPPPRSPPLFRRR